MMCGRGVRLKSVNDELEGEDGSAGRQRLYVETSLVRTRKGTLARSAAVVAEVTIADGSGIGVHLAHVQIYSCIAR